ncbi:hypothetical protein G6699_09745 [Polynucleobacter paneuropaeus]|jgi:hypothetical protein|nr:hypothetical protein [Polynucleobacter paneuropaeus]
MSNLKAVLRFLASYSGAILISKTIYDNIVAQRNSAVHALLSSADANYTIGLTGIVFSKDRSIQLFALLETYCLHVKAPAPLKVIYDVSNSNHRQAYDHLQSHFLSLGLSFNIEFIEQSDSFKNTLIQVLGTVQTRTTFFLVDDIIFTGDVDFEPLSQADPLQTIIALRLGSNIKKSYTTSRYENPPYLLPSSIGCNIFEFKWFERGNEWSDPWSLDGNFLPTSELVTITKISSFLAPNSYEIALKTFNDFISGRKGACFGASKILNLPINKVQSEINNQSGDISPEFLLDMWEAGLKIDISKFYNYSPTAPHEEHQINFVSRLEA